MAEGGTRAVVRLASASPRIAIVEDDQVYRSYLSLLFKGTNCRVSEAESGRELLDILAAEDVDCVVLDYRLPAENGLSISAHIRETMRDPPPIVVLSAERNERTIIKAFRGGVSDYLLKDGLKPDEIFAAVSAAMERHDAQRARDAEVARLRQKAAFDDETGFYSRASIDERLAAVVRAGDDARCAVLLIRPDTIDEIRSRHGIVVADRAWRTVVARVKETLGVHDLGGRYDDQRLIVLADVDVRQKTVLQRCRALAEALAADMTLGATNLRVTASIGAAIRPRDGRSVADLLAAAEQALDAARERGRPYVLAGAEDEGETEATGDGAPCDAAESSRSRILLPTAERRAELRHRVLKRGHLVLPGLCSVIDCVVRDLSRGGARLRVEGHFAAPDEFHLVVLSSGERRRVSRRWQRGSEFGVQFVD